MAPSALLSSQLTSKVWTFRHQDCTWRVLPGCRGSRRPPELLMWWG